MKSYTFITLGVTALAGAVASAQGPQPIAERKPVFEATSVKRNKEGGATTASITRPGGNVLLANHTLRQLIGQAYGLDPSQTMGQVFGLPAWANSERFDVRAAVPGTPTMSQKRLMLQSLLEQRFKLKTRRETRQLPVFALVPTNPKRLGPQLRPHSAATNCDASAPRPGEAAAQAPPPARAPLALPPDEAAAEALKEVPCGRVTSNLLLGKLDVAWAGGRRVTMQMIAESLGSVTPMERPVQDRTGLPGDYDFTMQWNPQIPDLPTAAVDVPGLSFLQALREHVGLRLDAATGPIEVIVIDQVERPTPD